MLVTHIRLHRLDCCIFTHHILCTLAYIPTLHNPTPYIPTLPLDTYSTYIPYPSKPTYLPYPYTLTLPLQHNTPYDLHYLVILPLHTSEWACGWAVRLIFSSDRLLCGATSIGETITFEIVGTSCEKGGALNSPENTQFWQIQHFLPISVMLRKVDR